MLEFMRNAFYALVGVLCVGASVVVLTVTISVVIGTVRRTRKGGNDNVA